MESRILLANTKSSVFATSDTLYMSSSFYENISLITYY